jgi:hypothetical protein
VSNEKDVQEV